MQVLERASAPTPAVATHTVRDSALAVAGSVLLALIATWIVEFLSPRAAPVAAGGPPLVHYSLVQVGEPSTAHAGARLAHADTPELTAATGAAPALGHDRRDELSATDIERILAVADTPARVLIMLLLCGLGLEEAAVLRWRDVDLDAGVVRVPGASGRELRLPSRVAEVLEGATRAADGSASLWRDPSGEPLSEADLGSLVTCAAHDAGIFSAREIDGRTLRHTYIAHLARQGMRLADLERIVGYVPPSELSTYGALFPPSGGLPVERVNLTHPALDRPATAAP